MFNIEVYKEYLNEEIRAGKMKRKTADDYVMRLEELNCLLPQDADCMKIAEMIVKASAPTQGLKYIHAVKKYESKVIGSPGIYLYGKPLAALYEKYKGKAVLEIRHDMDTYVRKINGIPRCNLKLKLALRLQMKSGLRVAELAALEKGDFNRENGAMELRVRRGKGNKMRTVEVLHDSWLDRELEEYLQTQEEGVRIFDKADKIIRYAKRLDIKTHELRKVYARIQYQKKRKEGNGKRKARSAVSRQLGHGGKYAGTMTNKYLGKEWTDDQKK